jgi:hypothetical protein
MSQTQTSQLAEATRSKHDLWTFCSKMRSSTVSSTLREAPSPPDQCVVKRMRIRVDQ